MITKHITVFEPGLNNAAFFRIPSLITTRKGALIAAADARIDCIDDSPNNIDKYIRRSVDNGNTWSEIVVVADYPGKGRDGASAIDASMVEDRETGTIWMIFNHKPAGISLFTSQKGVGFDSNGYRLLYDPEGREYTLKSDGKVYFSNETITDMKVTTKGDVHRNGETIGNIYLKAGPLLETRTTFLQIVKSEDDGLTWSMPADLNTQIKEQWMGFCGAGPGVGIQLTKGANKGRLIFPVYFTNENGKMSNCVIYSDDHGDTWKRGESVNDGRLWEEKRLNARTMISDTAQLTESQIIEQDNGDVKVWMRNHAGNGSTAVSISKDGGETWGNVIFDKVLVNPICQASVIKCQDSGRVIWSNPANEKVNNRINGVVRLSEDDGNTWKYSRLIKPGGFAYSCLTLLQNGEIGLLYEDLDERGKIKFTRFTFDWIMGANQ